MACSYDVGVHDTGGGVQGVHCGVDAQLSDAAGEHGGGVQVSEGGGGGGICQVVGWHVDGLGEGGGGGLGGEMGDGGNCVYVCVCVPQAFLNSFLHHFFP